ncbi:MAG TPA: hypothetical protein VJA21_14700 [Verrucomicrobiae bacterium]
MKSRIDRLAVILGVLVLTGSTVLGGPMRRADVAADPVWAVHVDCDLLRSTALGSFILSEMEKPEAQAKLAAFQAMFSFDLRTQLHGLTLYSTGPSPADGVLLVYADFDPDRLVTLAKAAEDARETQYKQTVIYSWVDGKRKARNGVKPRTYAAIAGDRVVFAQQEERVAQALDVVKGATPSLAGGQVFGQLGAAGSTGFIQAAARKLDFAASAPNAAILRLSKLARFQLGETGQQVTATLALEANDEEVATNMVSIAQGLVALMKLQKEKPESAKIADALAITQKGPGLLVNLSLPAADVIEMMKAGAAHKAHRKDAKETNN